MSIKGKFHMRKRTTRGSSAIEFALVLPFLASLIIGTLEYGVQLVKELELQQVARDTASMTARGANMQLAGTQTIVARLGQELNWPDTGLLSTSPGVVYVSTIEYLDGTCNGISGGCKNQGQWVFLRSTVFGNTSLHSSNFGAPAACLPGCLDTNQNDGSLNFTDSLNNPGAVVSNFNYLGTPSSQATGFQPGQPAFLIEVAATTGPWNGGTTGYAFSLF
jgi:TadE-like protein